MVGKKNYRRITKKNKPEDRRKWEGLVYSGWKITEDDL
jgi:hypothetical protein